MYRSVTYIPSSLSLKMYEAWIGTQAYMIMLFTKISFLHQKVVAETPRAAQVPPQIKLVLQQLT